MLEFGVEDVFQYNPRNAFQFGLGWLLMLTVQYGNMGKHIENNNHTPNN
jgi:hypothetical protein